MALAAEGVHVTLTARGAEALAKTAAEIRKASPGVTVTEVAGDITTPDSAANAELAPIFASQQRLLRVTSKPNIKRCAAERAS